jgi:hypothetical protein
VSQSPSDSQISLTNTNPVNPAYVHLFFVDGSSCTVADQIVTLTQNQTISFLASDFDPGVTGYLIAVAVDRERVSGDRELPDRRRAWCRFESGHHANLPAIGVCRGWCRPAALQSQLDDGDARLQRGWL